MNLEQTKLLTRNKTLATVALILILALPAFIVSLPTTNAHTPPWTIPTHTYLVVTPNPVGVGQPLFVVMWLDKVPQTAAGIGGDRWQNYKVTISKPDGTTETLGPFTSDATSSTYTLYTPTQIGTYTFEFNFPGQTASLYNPINGIAGTASDYVNDTYLPSSATKIVTVQSSPVAAVEEYPLPTSYWSRPIEGQNTNWVAIASNWMNSPQIVGKFQPDGIAPNSAHIMWTKPLLFGGVLGGSKTGISTATFYSGLSYEPKLVNRIIMYGRLYYNLPRSDAASGNGYVCVDLQTGEQIYWQNMTMPTFGQFYDYESMNQHGIIENGYLWSTSGTTWSAYDPLDGGWLFSLTDVPSGTQVYGPNGEILVYRLDNTNHWIAQWNNTGAPNLALQPGTSTNAYQWRPVGKVVNASTAYDWNITIPTLPTGARIIQVIYGDMILGTSTTFAATTSYGTPDPWTMWAISLKPTSRGQLLWKQSYSAPSGNLSLVQGPVDLTSRVFTMYEKETMQFLGFSLDSGVQLWGPSEPMQSSYDFYNYLTNYGLDAAYGNLYTCSYGGVLYCFNMTTGKLSWTYGNGGDGNSTNSGLDTPWGNYPLVLAAIADGKVYVFTSEHSPNIPPYKGSRVRCIDAYTGEELWTTLGWGSVGTGNSGSFAIADGYMIYLNTYDMQVYCFGKGPSATTVEAPLASITQGHSLTMQGAVTDQSAGAKAKVASGQFNIVPAVSDDSMSSWMEYIYMQKPKPTDATGVQVKLTAVDPNGNTVDIATVTSDANGMYYYKWTPQLEGSYKVMASFAGSDSYWPSMAQTAVGVDAAATAPTTTPTTEPTIAPTVAPTTTATASPSPVPNTGAGLGTEVYIAVAAAVVIAVVAAAALMLRKRK